MRNIFIRVQKSSKVNCMNNYVYKGTEIKVKQIVYIYIHINAYRNESQIQLFFIKEMNVYIVKKQK